jgi:Protein of unknown function (DUF3592)
MKTRRGGDEPFKAPPPMEPSQPVDSQKDPSKPPAMDPSSLLGPSKPSSMDPSLPMGPSNPSPMDSSDPLSVKPSPFSDPSSGSSRFLPPSFRESSSSSSEPSDYSPPSAFGRKIGLLIAFAIPVILIGLGLWMMIRIQQRSAKVQGVVKSVDCKENDDNGNCTTVIEYTPVNGKTMKVTLKESKFAKDQTVTIRYDPADPTNYSINEISLRTWGLMVILLATIILAITILVWWIRRKNNAEIGSDVV